MDERSKIETVLGNKNFWGREIKKKGSADVNKLYNELIPWFHDYKYLFLEKNLTGSEKPEGREEKIEWHAQRKIDSYFRFNIEVEMVIRRWRGENAEINIRFKAYLEKDYKDKFSRRYSTFGDFLRKLYERYIIKDRVDKLKGKLYLEISDLITRTKRTVNLITTI